ncbi:MAG TPA: hypothetical protein VFS39_11835 [Nitrospira sp.]|nr:hypothetical protein [Nitrospira sp.]
MNRLTLSGFCLMAIALAFVVPVEATSSVKKGKQASSVPPHKQVLLKETGRTERGSEPAPPHRANRSSQAKTVHPKGHRVKIHKKVDAVVVPKIDRSYHGLLKTDHRYETRHGHQTSGIRYPEAHNLAREHFEELDRNRDGLIDPVEQAFGRLDMERDLSIRRP